jgi:type II secretory pathway pseudopilin PulG
MPVNFENDPEFRDVVPKKSVQRRFTLVRLLVALGIILFAMALLLPATRSARPAARRAVRTNNMSQIALALLIYESEYVAFAPAAASEDGPLDAWNLPITGLIRSTGGRGCAGDPLGPSPKV